MKNLIFVILSISLIGCSSNWHLKRAIKKNPDVKTEIVDTIRISKIVVDTIYNSDSTYYIEQRIFHYDTIIKYQKYDFSDMRTWFETWQTEKTARKRLKLDSSIDKTRIRQENKTDRYEDKQHRKEANNAFKWLFFITLAVLAVVLFLFKRKK